MESFLFVDSHGITYTHDMVLQKLKNIGAHECNILFVHTDIMFGSPNLILGRKGYLQALYNVLLDLGVDTLIFPAFSYSFCNHEIFDVRNSRTSMGALIEYIRKQPNVRRSLDPLLSMIAVGKQTDLMDGELGHQSLGLGSDFDRLHQAGGVKFLFFGAEFSEYFTYIHHIEKILNVPYRFDMPFTGTIIDYNGHAFEHTHSIHTQCGGVTLKNFSELKKTFISAGFLKTEKLGDCEICCISEEDVYREVIKLIQMNPYSFVEPYSKNDLTHEYTFGKNGERVTHC